MTVTGVLSSIFGFFFVIFNFRRHFFRQTYFINILALILKTNSFAASIIFVCENVSNSILPIKFIAINLMVFQIYRLPAICAWLWPL